MGVVVVVVVVVVIQVNLICTVDTFSIGNIDHDVRVKENIQKSFHARVCDFVWIHHKFHILCDSTDLHIIFVIVSM